ncbi:MAG: pyruvate kinase [Gammaproteobacteria bacterium]
MRRTKIIATVGPASSSEETLGELVTAGVDLFRLNFSHADTKTLREWAGRIRRVASQHQTEVGILADLAGPKIRIGRFRDGPVELHNGDPFTIDPNCPETDGTAECVGVSYANLPGDVSAGDRLLLADGQIAFRVESVSGTAIRCRVETGGVLSDLKGINREGGGLSAEALTEKDRRDIEVAAQLEVDYLAVSFPRDADDIKRARALLEQAGGRAGVIAKIERSEAVQNIDSILKVADAIMVARGDLAIEIGDWELAGVQKRLTRLAHEASSVVITATQMMESMVLNPVPTRAEVLDVANAVMDGTDAVMLSAESAVGHYPVRAVEAMARICVGAEKEWITSHEQGITDEPFDSVNEAIAMAAIHIANRFQIRAVATLTESGTTALLASRLRSNIPIFALTRHETTRRRVTLWRGVYPVAFDVLHANPDQLLEDAVATLRAINAVQSGDYVLFTKGDAEGIAGGTNSLKVIHIPT